MDGLQIGRVTELDWNRYADEINGSHQRQDINKLTLSQLLSEFSDVAVWDSKIKELYFGMVPYANLKMNLDKNIKRRLKYNIDKNIDYISDIRGVLLKPNPENVAGIISLYKMGNPNIIFRLDNAHVDLIPEVAVSEIEKLLKDPEIWKRYKGGLSMRLESAKEALARKNQESGEIEETTEEPPPTSPNSR